MVNLFVVRHGETEYNLSRHLQGQLDIPLSKVGEDGALALGKKFKEEGYRFDQYLTSPLVRAIETALIIRDELGQMDKGVLVLDEFIERSFGTWEGKHIENLHERMAKPSFSKVPGYEKDEALIKRVREGLDFLFEAFDGKKVLLVTHSNTLKAILICCDKDQYSFETKTANLDVVNIHLFENKKAEVVSLNLFHNDKEDNTA